MFGWLFLAILIMAFLEVVGVASILPFMQLIAEPESVQTNPWLKWVYDYVGFESSRAMLIAAGFAVITLITLSNIFSIITIWLQHTYSWHVSHQMCIRLLRTYMRKPYGFFLNKNTSELRAYLINEVNSLTRGVLYPLIELFSRATVALVIFVLLLVVSVEIALSAFFLLGGAYLVIYLFRQRLIKRLGEERVAHNIDRFKFLGELLAGIKTVKAYEANQFFYERYENASDKYSKITPRFNVITASPKYILEIIAFGGILTITLYIFIGSGDMNAALPILSLFAMAGYRLLPALQKAFAAAAKIRHTIPVLDKLYDDLLTSLNEPLFEADSREKMPFQHQLSLDNIAFRYDPEGEYLLKEFNVVIEKGEAVAFVGSTGSGKTTVVDLIVGLLIPESGTINIDGISLTSDNMAKWHHQIAYVPQDVFLYDDTIANNIVLGYGAVNEARLNEAAKMADIYSFINDQLPQGMNTVIGERGVRLSGGQRQRIGLARALYRQPAVLILDEATSALDNVTEKGIIDSLDNLPEDLTLIIIAHRLSTVRHANCIHILQNGQIIAKGTYDELFESNSTFREMVQLS